MTDEDAPLQHALDRLARGESGALQEVINLAYPDLVRQARAVMGGRPGTTLLHSAVIRLLRRDSTPLNFEGVGQFFAYTSRMLRNKIKDRVRGAGKATVVSLDSHDVPNDLRTIDFLDLHNALEELHGVNERLWKVTEHKWLSSMTNGEVACSLGVSEKAVEKDWTFAKAWLAQRLRGDDDTRTV